MGRHHYLIAIRLLLAALLASSFTLEAAEDAQEFYEPGIVLPEGEGREHILRACTRCHTLEGVPAFSKYWGYERWLPMVESMVKHGSSLSEEEQKIVARYLGEYFGTDSQ
jgi:hypothetical protein